MAFPFLVFYNTLLSHDLESEGNAPSPSFPLSLSQVELYENYNCKVKLEQKATRVVPCRA